MKERMFLRIQRILLEFKHRSDGYDFSMLILVFEE